MRSFTRTFERLSGGELVALGVLLMSAGLPVFGVGTYLDNGIVTSLGVILLAAGILSLFTEMFSEGVSRRRVTDRSKVEQ